MPNLGFNRVVIQRGGAEAAEEQRIMDDVDEQIREGGAQRRADQALMAHQLWEQQVEAAHQALLKWNKSSMLTSVILLRPNRWWQLPGELPMKDMQVPEGKTGEELFHLILSGIREIYEVDAVIAGGAVRDLAAGVTTHKDVDVFIPLTWDKFQFGERELGWRGPTKLLGTNYPMNPGGAEGCIFPTLARASSNVQGVNLDLVFMEKPISPEDVQTFPVFAQRGIWNLNSGLCLSQEAKADIESKTFTIDPAITDKNKIKNVLKKVEAWKTRAGYKDWKIIEPDVKEWWEAKEEMKEEKKQEPKKELTWGEYKQLVLGKRAINVL
jgi:hypothetical protein